MPAFKLRTTVEGMAEKYEIKLNGFQEERIKAAQRELDDGRIDVDQAMAKIEMEFGEKFKSDDYKKIRSAIV